LHGACKNQAKHFAPAAFRPKTAEEDARRLRMQLYGLKTCDTCRKALKALPTADFIDVRAQGVPAPVLAAAFARFGQALVNTRSTTWRGLSEEARARDPLALLADEPTLMKRPLIVAGDEMYLGWDKSVQAALGA
jgi:arsenate reductase